MSDHKNGEVIIESWNAIARYMAMSVSKAIKYERAGLPVHRNKQGMTNRVWAYRHELDAFRAKLKTNPPDFAISQPPKRKSAQLLPYKIASLALTALLLAITGVVRLTNDLDVIKAPIHQFVVNPASGHYELTQRLKAGTRSMIWKGPNRDAISENTALTKIALAPPEGTHSSAALSVFRKQIDVFRDEQHVVIESELLEGTIDSGSPITEMTQFRSVGFWSTPYYHGWIICVNARNQWVGALLFLSRDGQSLSVLYHPGHVYYAVLNGRHVIATATLNARPSRSGYRPALFKVDLFEVLAYPKAQILPFSPDTLDPALHAKYRIRHVPALSTFDYLAFAPRTNDYFLFLRNAKPNYQADGLLRLHWKFADSFEAAKPGLSLTVDTNLDVRHVALVDQTVPTDFPLHRLRSALHHQRWNGSSWDPEIEVDFE